MLGYILLLILTIASFIALLLGFKRDIDWVTSAGASFSIMFATLFITASIFFANKSSEASKLKEEREFYGELVQELPENVSFETISRIVSTAEGINRKIEVNKKRYDSPMIGFLYSREIAELEPIEIPKFTYKKIAPGI